MTFAKLSNLKALSQHLRYLTLAWRSAVTRRCHKAERKVTGATFSSNSTVTSPRENGWHLLECAFCSSKFLLFFGFIYTHQQLSQNIAPLKQLVPDQLLFQIPKVLLNVPLGCAELNRNNQAASSDVHVSLTQMVATTSSISSRPSVTQAPPNCVFPAPHVSLPIVYPCNIPTPPVVSFPSHRTTLRGVSVSS